MPFSLSSIDYNSMLSFGFSSLLIVAVLAILLTVMGISLYLYYMRIYRYKQYKCVIWERDSFGNTVETLDDAGIFYDNAVGMKCLWLKKNKVPIDSTRLWYVQGKTKTLYFIKCGNKNLKMIHPTVKESALSFDVGEEDLNWGLYEFRMDKLIVNKDAGWKAWVPAIAATITVIFMIFAMMLLVQKIDVLAQIFQSITEASKVAANVV